MTTYIDEECLPYFFCPGCGHGGILDALNAALMKLALAPREIVIVTDIGCVGLADKYFVTNTLHGLHGRSLTYASGVKLVNPDLKVIVLIGDGGCGIGGGHLLNAARRNIGLTTLVFNNLNYGMTGGQVAATTPIRAKTTTSPRGNPETPFNLPLLVYASGATYIARWTILNTREFTKSISDALLKKGFSFIEVLSPCPVNYGRRNKETPMETLKFYQEKTIIKNDAHPSELDIDFHKEVILCKFVDIDRPTFMENYNKICRPDH